MAQLLEYLTEHGLTGTVWGAVLLALIGLIRYKMKLTHEAGQRNADRIEAQAGAIFDRATAQVQQLQGMVTFLNAQYTADATQKAAKIRQLEVREQILESENAAFARTMLACPRCGPSVADPQRTAGDPVLPPTP